MPYVLKPNELFARDPNSTYGYLPQNVIATQTADEQVALVEAAGASTIAAVRQAVSDSQSAIDTIISVAGQGTDAGLTQSGAAADAKVVGDELSDLKSAVANKALMVAPGKNLYNPALNQSGRMYTNAVGSKQTTTTSDTQVYQKTVVDVGQSYALSGISKCSLTDANDIVISYPEMTGVNCIIQSVPNNVKYLWIETAASYATGVTQVEKGTTVTAHEPYNGTENVVYGDTIIFKKNDVHDIKENIAVENALKVVTGFDLTAIGGYVNSSGGFVSAATGWERTDYIETVPGATCKASLIGYSTNPIVAFYDANKTYMSEASVKSNSQLVVNVDTVVPNGAKYVIFVSQTSYTEANYEIQVPATIGEAVGDLIENETAYKGVKVLCLGDSLTAGRDGSGNILQHNYPYYMQGSRLKGCTIINGGVVGSTTKTYWDNDKLDDVPLDQTIDVVLCMWGTNGGLVNTGALARDVEPYDDYEDYADTGVGCYCKIIEYVMEQTQNNAQIILITPPYNGNTSINSRVIDAQPVVKQIAERYNLPVIDMFKCGISAFNYAKFMPVDSVHFSEYGYEWIGKYIGGCVDAVCSKIN